MRNCFLPGSSWAAPSTINGWCPTCPSTRHWSAAFSAALPTPLPPATCAHILKSQMNAILRSLERKGFLERSQSQEDRRQLHLRLLPQGRACYTASHRQTLALVDRLIASVGEDKIRTLIPLLQAVTERFNEISKEV